MMIKRETELMDGDNLKVGIISDTHIGANKEKFEVFLNKHLKDVSLIIHAGDYHNKEVIDIIERRSKFIGVYGNVDNEEIRNRLKEKVIIELMDYKIGIYHGHGIEKTTLERAYREFKDDYVDIIVFGHSHQPLIRTKNNILMLNPGSPTNRRRERWFSYILLELLSESINASIKFLNA